MEPQLFDLNCIFPNPWQPREKEDMDHVLKIAQSIAAQGMMQIPIGRVVCAGEIQLAFGHTRLAAYRLIDQVQRKLENLELINFEDDSPMAHLVAVADQRLEQGVRFNQMPILIRELTNEEMFALGIQENIARKDLSPMEEARAMLKYREEFQKTSAQIGALFGLNEATVRGKLHLLKLPAELQESLAGVRELVLREIVFMLDLPRDIRERAEGVYGADFKPSNIIKMAAAGHNAQFIANLVTKLANYWAKALDSAGWKHDRANWAPSDGIIGPCKGCAWRIQREGKTLCLKTDCFNAKQKVQEHEYLEKASQASGIQILDKDSFTSFSGYSDEGKLEIARKAGCENLRLMYVDVYTWERRQDHHDRVDGYPRAQIVCQKRNGFCTCQKAVEAGVRIPDVVNKESALQQTSEQMQGQAEEQAAPALTADDLKEVARAVTRQKRQNAEEVKAMREDLAKHIAAALAADNPAVWLQIMNRYEYGSASKHKRKDWENAWHDYAQELRLDIAKKITEQIYDTSYSEPDPARALSLFNAFLKDARLPILEPKEEIA